MIIYNDENTLKNFSFIKLGFTSNAYFNEKISIYSFLDPKSEKDLFFNDNQQCIISIDGKERSINATQRQFMGVIYYQIDLIDTGRPG